MDTLKSYPKRLNDCGDKCSRVKLSKAHSDCPAQRRPLAAVLRGWGGRWKTECWRYEGDQREVMVVRARVVARDVMRGGQILDI